jgi:2-dehydro-3-deoxyphosphogluconate aldolase/(4S)-4-hydroxy-2-oxoglutarate aldolase
MKLMPAQLTHSPATKERVLEELAARKVVAVVRAEGPAGVLETVEALVSGGLTAIEITFTTNGAIDLLRTLADKYRDNEILLGAGTVLDAGMTTAAIEAGANYIVSPSVELDVIAACQQANVVSIPGAFTPTEIRSALKAGADVVKIFPASIGGAKYLKDLSGPFPGVRLLPSGSVSFETVGAFLAAGSFAVAVGSLLVDKQLMRERKFDAIAERTRRFMELVRSCQPT